MFFTSRTLLLGSSLKAVVDSGRGRGGGRGGCPTRAEGSRSRAVVKFRNLISELVRVSSR